MSNLTKQDEDYKNNKTPLLGEFILISVVAMVVFALLAGWFGWSDYKARTNFIMLKLESESEKFEHSLVELIDTSEYLSVHISSQIKDQNNDLDYIASLLNTFSVSNKQSRDIFSLSLFSWADAKGNILVNSETGILKEPVSVKDRDSFKMARFYPNKLHFSAPDYGRLSKQYIVPVSMGVTDSHGKFVGAIVFGYNIEGLRKRLNSKHTSAEYINYIITDKNNNFILSSFEDKETLNSNLSLIKDKIKAPLFETHNYGFLNEGAIFRKESFTYFIKSTDYPFNVFLIYDKATSDKEIYEALVEYNIEILIMGLVMISFFIVFRNRIVKPVIDLSHVAERIATGETHVEIPAHEAYEIDILARKLSEIQNVKQQLHKARDEIKFANQKLEVRVKERTFELEKALQAKSEFLNNMSHEIRTPIHGVQGYSEVLLEDWQDMEDEEKMELVAKLHKASYRLLELINNLLDLSRYTSGKMNIEFTKDNLSELTQDVIEELEPLYLKKKPIELEFVFDKKTNYIAELDKERIKQVIRNLLANALKFTAKGNVEVKLKKSKLEYEDGRKVDALKFTVKDEGIGIPKEELGEIFDAFSQSSRTKSKAGGTGLGLSISYEIILAHHGKIWAENNKDKGASFHFLIPIKNVSHNGDNTEI